MGGAEGGDDVIRNLDSKFERARKCCSSYLQIFSLVAIKLASDSFFPNGVDAQTTRGKGREREGEKEKERKKKERKKERREQRRKEIKRKTLR